ncbi:hypothetical protein PQR57_45495 [Paraburkholderia dipogonis]|uniref:Uncharacterized protein n=1 Tax=Paraburkholderia dipogonis TaxID=1211383 RepID=A0ABW9B5F8_9BURK
MRKAFDREFERSEQVDTFGMRRNSRVCTGCPLIVSIWSTARYMWIVFHTITALESSASAEDTAASGPWRLASASGSFDVDRRLYSMDRLHTIEHLLQFGTECRIGAVVGEVNRANRHT